MTDNWGDGWNGNTLEIGNDLEFTITFGANASALFEVGEGGCGNFFGCTDPSASNYNADALEDNGSCEYDCSAFTDDNGISYESLELNLDGGSWQSEISWEIVDANGDILLSAGAPYSDVTCLPIGCYTVNMYDEFGDGWSGNIFTCLLYTSPSPRD